MAHPNLAAAPRQQRRLPSCPYCGGSAVALLAAPDINRRTTAVVFHLVRCTACGLSFLADPPADLAPYYAGDYHLAPPDAQALEPHLPGQRFKLDLVRRFKERGSLLEIGPSIGIFCRLAQRQGFDVSAIEYDDACARFLAEKLGIRVVHASDPAAVIADERRSYDVICLWHSAEHLAAPWLVLAAAARALNPGGILVIAAPNPAAWQFKVMGARWAHLDLPRHLFQLPMPWLAAFARQIGLGVVLATTRDEGSLYWNRFAWAMLLRSMAQGALARRVLWRCGMLIGWVLQIWEGREGIGSSYTIVLQRPA